MNPKYIVAIITVLFFSCNSKTEDSEKDSDTIRNEISVPDKTLIKTEENRTFSNRRFKDVIVQKIAENTYSIQGKGQIFEANFGWVVEDGHEEIKSGFQMTDAGAPEWGNFNFEIAVEKKRANSTLTLILFETSAKDGSRQYELPLMLE